MKIRPLDWPADRDALLALDLTFTIEEIYRVGLGAMAILLEPVAVPPTRHANYSLRSDIDELPDFAHVAIAEDGGRVVGIAALKYEAWNRRAVLWHCYVDAAQRGGGTGRALLQHALTAARQMQARCLWLETQNTNVPAIRFYQRAGFRLCGLDTTLYDPADVLPGEVALFFAHTLAE